MNREDIEKVLKQMTLETIGDFIINNGIAVVVVVYFLWKDSKLTKENTEILMQVKALLNIFSRRKERGIKNVACYL